MVITMSLQAQLNKQALNMLPKVSSALIDATYYDQMHHAAITMICDSYKPLIEMSAQELNDFDEMVVGVFREREWVGVHPERFRFDQGSLFEYNKDSNAYIHCFRQAGCNTKQKAINEYLSQSGEQ